MKISDLIYYLYSYLGDFVPKSKRQRGFVVSKFRGYGAVRFNKFVHVIFLSEDTPKNLIKEICDVYSKYVDISRHYELKMHHHTITKENIVKKVLQDEDMKKILPDIKKYQEYVVDFECYSLGGIRQRERFYNTLSVGDEIIEYNDKIYKVS